MGGATQTFTIDGTGLNARRRVLSLLLPVLLLAAMLIMVADRADASTAGAGVAAAAVTAGATSSTGAQISISAIICPILRFLQAAFGPFFSGIFNSLLVAFGCIAAPSGVPGGGIDDDDDDDNDD